jgi:hypothetical protein
MTDYEIPTGPIDHEPPLHRRNVDQLAVLVDILNESGVDLGEHDQRIVAWLSRWEWSTVATIASWIKRASASA